MRASRLLGLALFASGAMSLLVSASQAIVGDTHRRYAVDLLRPATRTDKATSDRIRALEAAPAWQSWRAAHPGWRAQWNARAGSVHRAWGRFDNKTNEPTQGVFFVDRAGQVDARNSVPVPLDDPQAFIEKYVGAGS